MSVPEPDLATRLDIFLGKRQADDRHKQNLPQMIYRQTQRILHRLGWNFHGLLYRKRRRIVLDHLSRRAQHPQPLPLPQQWRGQQ